MYKLYKEATPVLDKNGSVMSYLWYIVDSRDNTMSGKAGYGATRDAAQASAIRKMKQMNKKD